MRRTVQALSFALVVFLLVSQVPSHVAKTKPDPTPAPQAAAAGILLTQALTTLVTAVLPAVPDLTKKLMGGKDSIKSTDLEKNIKAQQTETRTQVDEAVGKLQRVSTELDAILKFVPATAEAKKNLFKMKGTIDSFPTNEADRTAAWAELNRRWTLVSESMTEIQKVPEAQVNNIVDAGKRAEFVSLQLMAKGDTIRDIKGLVEGKNIADLRLINVSINSLLDKLEFVSIFEGIQLATLRDSIAEVKNIPALKPVPEATPKKTDQDRLEDLLREP